MGMWTVKQNAICGCFTMRYDDCEEVKVLISSIDSIHLKISEFEKWQIKHNNEREKLDEVSFARLEGRQFLHPDWMIDGNFFLQ